MSEQYVSQAWRFGDGPNQYYADLYAQTMARVMDFDLDYDDDRFEQYKAEFLADLAAHDRQVKAEALREASAQCSNVAFGSNADVAEWLLDRARIESEARP